MLWFMAPLTREPGRAAPRHVHGDLTSLAPHERLPEILVVSFNSMAAVTIGSDFGAQKNKV